MNVPFFVGIIGLLFTVTGAAWSNPKHTHTPFCTKNYLFTVGNSTLFAYSVLQYLQNGSLFFVMLECIVLLATVLMYTSITDTAKAYLMAASGIGCLLWSLTMYESLATIVFIAGIAILSAGYSFTVHTMRREVAFVLGSLLIAVFSYLEPNWIFCILNIFFAGFSGWHLLQQLQRQSN